MYGCPSQWEHYHCSCQPSPTSKPTDHEVSALVTLVLSALVRPAFCMHALKAASEDRECGENRKCRTCTRPGGATCGHKPTWRPCVSCIVTTRPSSTTNNRKLTRQSAFNNIDQQVDQVTPYPLILGPYHLSPTVVFTATNGFGFILRQRAHSRAPSTPTTGPEPRARQQCPTCSPRPSASTTSRPSRRRSSWSSWV